MLRPLKSLWLVPALLLGACGPTDLPSGDAPAGSDTATQGVLFPPPAPASGNILDSTTYMGSVPIPGSVQTYFTVNPQYYSFSVNVPANSVAKFEVTHGGSSMYLDTGLFVYGPKNASGSYGTTLRAYDDDAGYGQLSRMASVTFTQGGEYLVVVSSGSGVGKQFRLQLDCLSPTCTTAVPPAVTLSEAPVSASLQAELAAANTACGSSYSCYGELRGYSFPWSHPTPASLDAVADAVSTVERSYAMDGIRLPNMSYAQFVQSRLLSGFTSLDPDLLNEYSNGTEDVQVTGWSYSREMWPDACMIWELYVIYFPQSDRVLVFEQDHGQEC
ncbi:hypothetical protein ACLESO_03015 [Pyxidicoccus sp. 3LG]